MYNSKKYKSAKAKTSSQKKLMYNSKKYKSAKAKTSSQKKLTPKHVLDVLNFYGNRLGVGSFSEKDAKIVLRHDTNPEGYGGWGDDKEGEVCYNFVDALYFECHNKYFDRDYYNSLPFQSKKAKEYSKSVDEKISKVLPHEDEVYRALFGKKPRWK